MKPVVVRSVSEWQTLRRSPAFSGKQIGFVPTMGALHPGHISLLERARSENDLVVLSIFVNPTQFNDPGDYERYPNSWDTDLQAAESAGVDYIFAPSREEMYPDDYRYRVTEDQLSNRMEGEHRPGHFDGVLTVVLKLLLLVGARRAYFGEKDRQQLLLVRDLAAAFFLPVEIVSCPTIRDADGLALSSRNRLLSATARRLAADFPRVLREEEDLVRAKATLEDAGFGVDYVENYGQWRFGAVRLEGIRLIDNVCSKHPL